MAVATPQPRPFWRPVRTDDAHRPTMLELFFDVVYVYAFTQVSGIIIHTSTGVGVLQALVMLGLLWWTWSNAGWFANQTRADIGRGWQHIRRRFGPSMSPTRTATTSSDCRRYSSGSPARTR